MVTNIRITTDEEKIQALKNKYPELTITKIINRIINNELKEVTHGIYSRPNHTC